MKYKLTEETKDFYGATLYRIEAVESFGNVKAGEKGGWIEKEENLSQAGDCWVCDNACMYGNARVYGNAQVCDNACVRGNACVCDDARVYGNAQVYDDACVYGNAQVYDDARITSDDDWLYVKGLGSVNRGTTVCRTKKGVIVVCGCFCGDLDEFAAKVIATHGNSKYAREYLSFIEPVKIHFGLEDKEDV